MNEDLKRERKIECIVKMLRRLNDQDLDLAYRLIAKMA